MARPELSFGIGERLGVIALIVGVAGVAASVTLPPAIQEQLAQSGLGPILFWVSLGIIVFAVLFFVCDLAAYVLWKMGTGLGVSLAIIGTALIVVGGIVGLVGAFKADSAVKSHAGLIDLTRQLGQTPNNREQLFQALTAKWTQLIETNETVGNPKDRPLIDEQMRQAFAAVAGNAEARQIFAQGPSLIVRLSHNTFLVLNPVTMRASPNLFWKNLPKGVAATVISNSAVGFIVIFTPFTTTISTLPTVFASAEL